MRNIITMATTLGLLSLSFAADSESELSRTEIRQILESMHQDYLAQPPYRAKVRVETIINRPASDNSGPYWVVNENEVYNDTGQHRFALRLRSFGRPRGDDEHPTLLRTFDLTWTGEHFFYVKHEPPGIARSHHYSDSPRFETYLKTFLESGHVLDGLNSRIGFELEGKLRELNDLEYHYAPTLLHFIESVMAVRKVEFNQEFVQLKAETPSGNYRVHLRNRGEKWVLDTIELTRTHVEHPLLVPERWRAAKIVHAVTVTAHKEIAGILIPVEGIMVDNSTRLNGEMSNRVRLIRRSNIVINPDFDALGVFDVEIPVGTTMGGDHPHRKTVFIWDGEKAVPRELYTQQSAR